VVEEEKEKGEEEEEEEEEEEKGGSNLLRLWKPRWKGLQKNPPGLTLAAAAPAPAPGAKQQGKEKKDGRKEDGKKGQRVRLWKSRAGRKTQLHGSTGARLLRMILVKVIVKDTCPSLPSSSFLSLSLSFLPQDEGKMKENEGALRS